MNKVLIIVFVIIVVAGLGYYVVTQGKAMNQAPVATPVSSGVSTTGVSSSGATTAPAKEFTVSGSEFAFSPSTLTVTKGDTVKVTFTNNGAFPHNFVINEFNVKGNTVQPGQSDTVTFTADKSGTFQYYCSVPGHKDRGMVGSLIVQ